MFHMQGGLQSSVINSVLILPNISNIPWYWHNLDRSYFLSLSWPGGPKQQDQNRILPLNMYSINVSNSLVIQGTTMQSNANYEFHGGVYQIVTWYLHCICSHSEHKTPATKTNYELQVGRETQQKQ